MQKVLQQDLSTLLLDDGVAWLMATTRASMAVRPWLPNGPLAGNLRLQALPLDYGGWLLAILLGYCLLTTLMKRVYIRRFGWQ